jgi:hypothetical protein
MNTNHPVSSAFTTILLGILTGICMAAILWTLLLCASLGGN